MAKTKLKRKVLKEKRLKRIVASSADDKFAKGQVTLTTYRKFKKRFPTSVYDRKNKQYDALTQEDFAEYKAKRKRRKISQEKKEEVIIPDKRIRKQVVLNMRSHEEPYAMSIRALTINPEINHYGMKLAILETLREVDIDFDLFYKKEFGYETVEIATNEDSRLNDYRVHVEILIKKNPPMNFVK